GGAWRALLMAQEVDLSTSRLNRVQGELVVYPRAKLVTLDFPVNGKLPQVQEGEGLKAILKQVRSRPGAVTATVGMEWSPSLSVARVNPEAPYGISALTQ